MSHVQTVGAIPPTSSTTIGPNAAGSAVASGNGVVGYCFVSVATGTLSVTVADDKGNTYPVPDAITSGTGFFFQFYRPNITNGPTIITATFTGGTISLGLGQMYWEEFTDLSSGKALDAHSLVSVATATGTNGYKSGTLTTQNVSEFVFAVAMQLSGAATLTAGTTSTPAWTADLVDNSNQFYSEFLTQTASSIQAVWTATDATSTYFLGIMTFGILGVSTTTYHYNLTVNI